MNSRTNSAHYFFVSDVDDTLLGDEVALIELMHTLSVYRQRITIAYNSSRPCASLRNTLAQNTRLAPPDYLIGALGTEIQCFETGKIINPYSPRIIGGWQRNKIASLMSELGFEAHQDEYQTPFKASYHVPGSDQYRRVLAQLKAHNIEAKVIYSGNKNLDIIPVNADKGKAIDLLRNALEFNPPQVVVAGDSANDRDMFLHGFKGIVVANADADLKSVTGPAIYHARSAYAAGVLEGLRHWNIVNCAQL